MTALDSMVSEREKRFYTRLVRSYESRMEVARDKAYAHSLFLSWGKAQSLVRKEFNEDFAELFRLINEKYRLGSPIAPAIQRFREFCHNHRHNGIVETYSVETDDGEWEEREGIAPTAMTKTELDKKSDHELACLFADQIAKDRFYGFLKSKELDAVADGSNRDNGIDRENTEKNKDFTTSRQVLAIHFLMKYIHVRDADKSEIARFVQFLTGKNYDNIYKKVLSPYSHSTKTFKQDLRFVREYFEKLNLQELVRMVNNEMEG